MGRVFLFTCATLLAVSPAVLGQTPPLGRSDPAFQQPSLAPGVDYVVPTPAEIKSTLDRVRDYFVRSTHYRIVNTTTGQPITELSVPVVNAGVEEFNDWDYPIGVALAGMLHVFDVTGDATYRDYTLKNFDFIFDHLDYFRRQAAQFGPQARGYRRLLQMAALDDCGAIGAALLKAYARKPDPRYRETIDAVADYISHKQMRLPDGTLARARPQPVSLWIDDAYMSIPFLAQMGKLTGNRAYYDDGARQVIQMAQRLQDPATGLYDHSWYENTNGYDPRFFWGRGDGWALMSAAELLSVLPEDHPQRARVLEIFRQAARGVVETQGANGMWHQLLNKNDSYLETSASAMFTFAIARGVNRGWLSPAYAPVAQTGWQAVATHVLSDGRITGICVSTTAAYDAVYYYNRPTDVTAMQGYGPVLMAGAEVIAMLGQFNIDHNLNTFHYHPKR
jgi:unsaturated rhamnogalacturonyl hydrolase